MSEGEPDLRARLRKRISGFCEFVRSRGLPVGIGTEVDFAQAAEVIDLLDRPIFRASCGATLARSPEQLQIVNTAFDAYWSNEEFALGGPSTRRESATLAPARDPREGSRPRQREESEVEPPVMIPIGTYSASAPSSPHLIRALPEREMRNLRRGARRFRRHVATVRGRRHGPSRRGDVDLRGTMRQSLRHGGEWVELRRERPRTTRALLVVLWDISGSMREHESRMFALVHALESVSRSARVFAFSTRVEEITSEVRRYGYRRAAAAVGRRIERADGGTRIGRSLREFAERYGPILGRRTTLVILSDGWDLGEAESVGAALEPLARRTHRIVWVTPYTRRPGFEPRVGALRAALAHVDELLGPEDFEAPWPLRPFLS